MYETIRRAEHQGAWGPLTPEQLRWRLSVADRLARDSANRSGRHPTDAWELAWEAITKAIEDHSPMARVPWHAAQAIKRVQSLTYWPAI